MDVYQMLDPASENGFHKTIDDGNTHVALAPSEIEEAQDLRTLKLISDHAADGISLLDREGRHIYVNQTLCDWTGYTQEEYLRLRPLDMGFDLNQADFQHYFDRAFQEVITPVESILKRKDGSTLPIEVSMTGVVLDGKPLLFGVARDITLRKQVQERQERYMRYLSLRAYISQALARHSSLYVMLQSCCEAMVHRLHASSARIWTMNGDEQVLELQASAGGSSYHLDTQQRIAMDSKIGGLVRKRQPYLINDMLHNPFINDKNWALEEGIVALAGYPLILDGQIVGMMTLFAQKQFTEETFNVLTLVAEAIAQGIGRKWAEERLEKQVEQRTRELSLLLQASHIVASTFERGPLLNTILTQLKSVVDYSSAILYGTQEGLLVPLASRSVLPAPVVEQLVQCFQQGPVHRQVSQQSKAFIFNDLPLDEQFRQSMQRNLGADAGLVFAQYRSWMGIPLIANGHSIGLLTMAYHLPGFYTQHHADLAFALANQAAIALENVFRHEQAQALAAMQERQHLARELHDSVSQEFYGVVLNAHIAHEALKTDPDEARTALDRVIEHADTGQTEMRSLLFELTPQALAAEGLVVALQRRVTIIRKHYNLNVAVFLSAEPFCSLEKKHALYRIAQEALHNVIKHARATIITLKLAQEEQELLLEVHDNGKGFDPTISFPGGLGLRSIKERVAGLHGILSIRSKPEQGSSISVRIPTGT